MLRLLARVPRGRPLTTPELAERSGLPPAMIEAISRQTDWSGIDLPTARRFMSACNADLTDRNHCRRIYMYLKSQPRDPTHRFAYLQRSPDWQGYYLPLIELLTRHLTHGPGNTNPAQRR